jgi:hypothetical protein
VQSEKEVEFRKAFLDSLEARSSNKAPTVPHLDIRKEITCLREVKDIRDEVNMIENILQHQSEVFDQMVSLLERQMEISGSMTSSSSHKHDIEEALTQLSSDRTITILRQRWKRLDEDAERVEKSVCLNVGLLTHQS